MATKDSTVQSTISKKDSAKLLAGSLVFGLFLVILNWRTLFSYVAILACAAVSTLAAIALAIPNRFRRGVRLIDGGFEHVSPLRGVQLIRFDAIQRIEAVATGGSDAGDDVPFVVYAGHVKALVLESDLYGTGLFDRLTSLPGFKHDVLQKAFAYEVKGLEILVGRKYPVYERT